MTHIRIDQRLIEALPLKKLKIIENEQGMTLLEVLLALVILTLVLVTLLNNFVLAGRQNSDTYRYNEALSLAQSKMEEIKKKDIKIVDNIPLTSFSLESDYAQFQGLKYTVTVEPHYNTVNNLLILYTKTVTVTVSYSDEGIARQLLALTAEVGRR